MTAGYLTLRHYSATSKALDCGVIDPAAWAHQRYHDYKPLPQHVLWLSVGTAWIRWVKSEMPQWLPRYKKSRAVQVDASKLIVIDTARKARAFGKKYGAVSKDGFVLIEWARVVEETAGKKCGLLLKYDFMNDQTIEAMYMDFAWAKSFDVSSAVIWSPECLRSCVKSSKPRPAK
jgi:hypothetical protein